MANSKSDEFKKALNDAICRFQTLARAQNPLALRIIRKLHTNGLDIRKSEDRQFEALPHFKNRGPYLAEQADQAIVNSSNSLSGLITTSQSSEDWLKLLEKALDRIFGDTGSETEIFPDTKPHCYSLSPVKAPTDSVTQASGKLPGQPGFSPPSGSVALSSAGITVLSPKASRPTQQNELEGQQIAPQTALKTSPEAEPINSGAAVSDTSQAAAQNFIQSPPPVAGLLEVHPPPSPRTNRGEWKEIAPVVSWCPDRLKNHLPYDWNEPAARPPHYAESKRGLGGWRLIAATRRGRMHAHNGTHREDSFAMDTGSWFSTACVCDGAGSCKFSRIGAETTARLMTRMIREHLMPWESKVLNLDGDKTQQLVREVVVLAAHDTQKRLEKIAKDGEIMPADLRCTMLVVVHLQSPKFSGFVVSQVGDGFIASRGTDGSAARHGESDSGEYSGQVNCFMPDDKAWQKAKSSILQIPEDGVDAIVLCSDGVEDPFFPIPDNVGILFKQLYEGVKTPLPDFVKQSFHGSIVNSPAKSAEENLMAWLGYEKRGENDDRTIVVLHRTANTPTPSGSEQPHLNEVYTQ